MSGAFIKQRGYLFAFKNFSYARSFLPLQFWNSSLKLDANNKLVELQVSCVLLVFIFYLIFFDTSHVFKVSTIYKFLQSGCSDRCMFV